MLIFLVAFYFCSINVRGETSNLIINTTFSSPNFDKRPSGPPYMIVIHDTEGSFESSLQWLTDPASQVSAHYLIDLSGPIYRLVNESDRAWHAGTSYWHNVPVVYNLNDISIGIELVNTNSAKNSYPAEQITALINLLFDIGTRYYIPLQYMVSHEDIAATRRTDPGPHFPWQRLVDSGLCLAPAAILPNQTQDNLSQSEYIINIRRMLLQIGYQVELQNSSTIDQQLTDNFRSFQWRFAPDYANWTLNEVYMAPYEIMVAVNDAYQISYGAKKTVRTSG
jgi:N-acetylmuramoyl-L-alanine amidase